MVGIWRHVKLFKARASTLFCHVGSVEDMVTDIFTGSRTHEEHNDQGWLTVYATESDTAEEGAHMAKSRLAFKQLSTTGITRSLKMKAFQLKEFTSWICELH